MADDETKGRRPKVAVFLDCVRVELSTRRKGDEGFPRIYMDDGSIAAFIQWQSDNNIFPLRGYGAVGGGYYSADFPAEHAEAIADYLTDAGLFPQNKAKRKKDAAAKKAEVS